MRAVRASPAPEEHQAAPLPGEDLRGAEGAETETE